MARFSIGLGVLLIAMMAGTAAASAKDPLQVPAAQAKAGPSLANDLRAQIDLRVHQAIADTKGDSPAVIAKKVAEAVSDIIAANKDSVMAEPALAALIAREAIVAAEAAGNLNASTLLQVATAVAAGAAKLEPAAAASVFVAVVDALPPDLQKLEPRTIIAEAVDAAAPGSQITASITPFSGPNAAQPNLPAQIESLVPLLTALVNQENVSPH